MKAGVVGLFIVLLFTQTLSADPSHTEGESSTSDSTSEGTTREKAKLELKKKAIDFIVPRFPLNPEYLEEVFGKSLPDAIESMMDNEFDKIAEVVAKMMGTVSSGKDKEDSKSQVEVIRDDAKKAIADEEGKDGEEQDKRYIALMDKFYQAALIKLGQKKEQETDEDKKFAEAFKKAYEPVREQNVKTNELIAKASKGETEATRTQALEELRKTIDVRNLPKYLDMQMASGAAADKTRAGNLLDAFTYTDPTTKKEFLTFFTKDGPEKVWFPEGNTGEKSLAALRGARKGFPNWTVAADQSIQPNKISTIEGEVVSDGPPKGSSGAALASAQPQAGAKTTPATPQEAVTQLASIANTRACKGCHSSPAITFKNGEFYATKDGTELPLLEAIASMESDYGLKGPKQVAATEMKKIVSDIKANLTRVLATK